MNAANNQSDLPKEVELVAGLNQLCVKNDGQYIINLIGCHTYDANVPTFINTNDDQPTVLTAIQHKNGVRILSDVSEEYKFFIQRSNKMETVNLVADKEKVDGKFVYRHDFYLKVHERVIIMPKNEIMLFKPESQEFVGGNDCMEVSYFNQIHFTNFMFVIPILYISRMHSHSMHPRV